MPMRLLRFDRLLCAILPFYKGHAISPGKLEPAIVEESGSPEHSTNVFTSADDESFDRITTSYVKRGNVRTFEAISHLELVAKPYPGLNISQYRQVSLVNEDALREIPYVPLVSQEYTHEGPKSMARAAMKASFKLWSEAVRKKERELAGCSMRMEVERKRADAPQKGYVGVERYTLNMTTRNLSEGFRISSLEFISVTNNLTLEPKLNVSALRNFELENLRRMPQHLLKKMNMTSLADACTIFIFGAHGNRRHPSKNFQYSFKADVKSMLNIDPDIELYPWELFIPRYGRIDVPVMRMHLPNEDDTTEVEVCPIVITPNGQFTRFDGCFIS